MRNLIPWGNRTSIITGRRDPFTSLQSDLNNLFQDFYEGYRQPANLLSEDFNSGIPVDITENEDGYILEADIPGVDAGDIDVSFNNNACIIKYQKEENSNGRERNYIRRERSWGACMRTINLPDNIDADKATATSRNGVLIIEAPKKAEAITNVKKIKVKAS